ncbi:MAG TPA: hypothetical protein VGF77_00485 [Allosphingosinicella sp.]
MNLVDRYIAAIRRSLPRNRAADISAELHDVIASRIEEREAMLGRPLDEDETKKLLRDFGHPWVVAARYWKQQYLIGPDVFPFYLSVLRIVLAVVVAIFVVVAAVNLLFNDYDVLHAIGQALAGLWISALINVAIVTIVFVVLERAGFPAEHLQKWDPGNLAEVKDKQPGPWESAIEVALSIVFLIWWSGLVGLPFVAGGRDFRLQPAPIFAALYWPIFALIAARLVHNLVQWLRPRWRTLRTALAALTTLGGLAVLALLYHAGHWVVVVSTGMPAAKAAELQTSVNLALKIAIVVTTIVWLFQAVLGIYRMTQARRFTPSPA